MTITTGIYILFCISIIYFTLIKYKPLIKYFKGVNKDTLDNHHVNIDIFGILVYSNSKKRNIESTHVIDANYIGLPIDFELECVNEQNFIPSINEFMQNLN